MPYGVVEISSYYSGQGKGAQPLIKGCSFSDGEQSMLVHYQKRWDPWEVDAQCNAILVAGRVQGTMPLYALMHENDHVKGDIIVEKWHILRTGAHCIRHVCCARAEAYILEIENHGLRSRGLLEQFAPSLPV